MSTEAEQRRQAGMSEFSYPMSYSINLTALIIVSRLHLIRLAEPASGSCAPINLVFVHPIVIDNVPVSSSNFFQP